MDLKHIFEAVEVHIRACFELKFNFGSTESVPSSVEVLTVVPRKMIICAEVNENFLNSLILNSYKTVFSNDTYF